MDSIEDRDANYMDSEHAHSLNPNLNSASIYHVPSFLVKLFEIVDCDETKSIVTWLAEGDGFVIKNQIAFSEKILPKYFKHNNFSSFIRQLNMYDFHKAKTRGSQY